MLYWTNSYKKLNNFQCTIVQSALCNNLQIVALLFGSGKVVFTGAKDLKNIKKAKVIILKELNKAGLIE